MSFDEFKRKIRLAIQEGTTFGNPGKGTSVITGLSDRGVSYVRGRAVIYFSFQDIFDAFEHFSGSRVTSNDLKSYKSSVFDSKANGHSCNCTFLFMLLQKMGLASKIGGQGIKGSPYFVEISTTRDE